jgi:hypothetical protein
MQRWISLACASLLFLTSLCGVLFVLFHPTGFRGWMFITATAFVLVGSYWTCAELAELTEETRTTGEG